MPKRDSNGMEVDSAGNGTHAEVPELKSFLGTLAGLQTMVQKLVEDKKSGGGKGAAAQELAKRCITKVAELRRDNRCAHDAADRLLREAEAERQQTDAVSQQLQNLQYQKIHLSRELNVCLSYKGTEGLDLISEEEFEAATTEEQRKGPRGSHDYELARLTVEMKKREEVIKALKQQELRRKLYEGKLASQRKFLDGLSGHLDTVHAAAEPVRKEFNKSGAVPSLDKADAHAASLLPPPLYSIYYQAHAYEVAFLEGSCASIVGDGAEALAYVKAQAVATPKSPSAADSKKRKRRKHLEDSDGESLLSPHPLSLCIKIPPKLSAAPTPTITLTLSYLPRLHVVTVKHTLSNSAVEQELLQDLFPADSGVVSPLPANDYLLLDPDTKKPLRFSDKRTAGRAYKWAQALAGLNFPPRDKGGEHADVAAKQAVPYGTVVDAIQERLAVSTQVKALLASLARLHHDGPPTVPGSELLTNSGASFESWKEFVIVPDRRAVTVAEEEQVTEEVAKAMEGDEAGEEEGETTMQTEGEEGEVQPTAVVHVTEREVSELGRRYHRYFRGVIAKQAWRLQVEVEMGGGYPTSAPVFALSLLKEGPRKTAAGAGLMVGADPMALSAATTARQNGEASDNALRSIEEELNAYAIQEAKKAECPPAQLLAYQLWVALHCFSVYVDVEAGNTLNTPRDHRGRDRRLPFLYSPVSRTLQQRV